ncbi:shikimate kinase [Abditibacteriota bacterium]|nr:shikimate kinase [Abditibacteriota bacterium]
MSAIFLLGFMGSGKSAVARALSRQLNLPLIDLDARIEQEIGTSIGQFFSSQGEEEFREVETRVLEDVEAENVVVSLGGGVPTRKKNREMLQMAARKGALVVYLAAQSQTLAERIRRQPGKRPLIDGGGTLDFEATRRRVEELMEAREAFYRECASFEVQTDENSIPQIAALIADEWMRIK